MMIKNYYDDEKLRRSMSELATYSFGLDFELLYQKGYWDKVYGCYSILEDDKIVSNVSYHLLELEKNGKRYSCMSIGSVMTYPEYRKKGYARQLMEAVLADHPVDVVYLSANESVLDFYPRFGFKAIKHIKHYLDDFNGFKTGEIGRKVNLNEELQLVDKYVKNRVKNSKDIYVFNDDYLKMFYALYLYSDCIYEHDKALIVCEKDEDILYVHDIYMLEEVDLYELIGPYLEGVHKIYFDFEVALENLKAYEDMASHFHIRTKHEELIGPWSFPATSVT